MKPPHSSLQKPWWPSRDSHSARLTLSPDTGSRVSGRIFSDSPIWHPKANCGLPWFALKFAPCPMVDHHFPLFLVVTFKQFRPRSCKLQGRELPTSCIKSCRPGILACAAVSNTRHCPTYFDVRVPSDLSIYSTAVMICPGPETWQSLNSQIIPVQGARLASAWSCDMEWRPSSRSLSFAVCKENSG